MQNEPAANAVELNRLLGPEGEETEKWKQYLVDFRARHNKWVRKNGIEYSAIVEGCEGHHGAMLVVMQRKKSCMTLF